MFNTKLTPTELHSAQSASDPTISNQRGFTLAKSSWTYLNQLNPQKALLSETRFQRHKFDDFMWHVNDERIWMEMMNGVNF